MHTSPITKIVIHCSATQNGKQLRTTTQTAAQRIDDWHKQRGFQRLSCNYKQFLPICRTSATILSSTPTARSKPPDKWAKSALTPKGITATLSAFAWRH